MFSQEYSRLIKDIDLSKYHCIYTKNRNCRYQISLYLIFLDYRLFQKCEISTSWYHTSVFKIHFCRSFGYQQCGFYLENNIIIFDLSLLACKKILNLVLPLKFFRLYSIIELQRLHFRHNFTIIDYNIIINNAYLIYSDNLIRTRKMSFPM